MNLFKKIITWIKNLFSTEEAKIEVMEILYDNINSEEVAFLKDPDLLNKAMDFVKDLHIRTDLTGTEKARIFNAKLGEYALKAGKAIGSVALNLIRELTLTALKLAINKGLITLLLANGERVTSTTTTCKAEPQQLELDLEPKA